MGKSLETLGFVELIDYDDGDKMYRVAWTWKGWEDGAEC